MPGRSSKIGSDSPPGPGDPPAGASLDPPTELIPDDPVDDPVDDELPDDHVVRRFFATHEREPRPVRRHHGDVTPGPARRRRPGHSSDDEG